MSARDLTDPARPPRLRIAVLLGLMVALPVSSYLSGQSVGAFRMFTDLGTCQVTLSTRDARGVEDAVPLATLAPHLGRDARRVLLPAARGALGETTARLAAGGLDDLARLVCALHPAARAAIAELHLRDVLGRAREHHVEVPCDASPR